MKSYVIGVISGIVILNVVWLNIKLWERWKVYDG